MADYTGRIAQELKLPVSGVGAVADQVAVARGDRGDPPESADADIKPVVEIVSPSLQLVLSTGPSTGRSPPSPARAGRSPPSTATSPSRRTRRR